MRVFNLVPSVSLLIGKKTVVWSCHVCLKIWDVEEKEKKQTDGKGR